MRVLILSTTTGYQLRAFDDAAKSLGYELAFATDRCKSLDDPWRDHAVAVKFHDAEQERSSRQNRDEAISLLARRCACFARGAPTLDAGIRPGLLHGTPDCVALQSPYGSIAEHSACSHVNCREDRRSRPYAVCPVMANVLSSRPGT